MKKNRTMRLAALLLVLTLITSCFVGGTFAKYISSVEGGDDARVAYWGFGKVANTVELDDLFKYTDTGVYDSNTDTFVEGLIAPGTTNRKTFQFRYAPNTTMDPNIAKPEVAYSFTVDTTGSTAGDLAGYDDIEWRLTKKNGESFDVVNGDWGTFAAMIADIKTLSGEADGSKEYAPNTLPDAFQGDEVYAVEWRWTFTDGDNTDIEDTALGNANTLANVAVNIKITAEQLNVYPTP